MITMANEINQGKIPDTQTTTNSFMLYGCMMVMVTDLCLKLEDNATARYMNPIMATPRGSTPVPEYDSSHLLD